jgi:hypothetical protein
MHRLWGKCTDYIFYSIWDHRLWRKCTDCIFTSNWDHRLKRKCTDCLQSHYAEKSLSILGGAKTVLVIFNCKLRPQTVGKMHRLWGKCTDYIFTSIWDHRLWGKCTDCILPQIETTYCEENAQIVFLTQIETTDCEENAQIVFLLQIECTDKKNAQTVYKVIMQYKVQVFWEVRRQYL